MPDLKVIAGIIGAILGFVGFMPYIISVLRNKTKPHVFTWLIWSVANLTVGFATLAKGGGNGALIVIMAGVISVFIMILSFIKSRDVKIYKMDWVYLLLALSSLPLWYFTKDPFWAVAILTFVDLTAYMPTIRKIKDDPFSENLVMYMIVIVRNLFILGATDEYNLTTVGFHLLTTLATLGLMVYSLILRKSRKFQL